MIRMKGNKTQVVTLNGEYSPERTSDSYRIEVVTFSGLHVPDSLQVEPWGASKLIEIHLGQGPESLDQGIAFIFLQLEKIFLEIRKVQVNSQDFSPGQRGLFLMAYFSLPSGRRLLTGPEMSCL